jgi:hypothetical protein
LGPDTATDEQGQTVHEHCQVKRIIETQRSKGRSLIDLAESQTAPLALAPTQGENRAMTLTSVPRMHEQRKIDVLLWKLARIKQISAQPAPIDSSPTSLKTA